MSKNSTPKTIFLRDYTPPDYLIDTVDLRFNLEDTETQVIATSQCRRNPEQTEPVPLVLMGQSLDLVRVQINDDVLTSEQYQIEDGMLMISSVPEQFTLEIETQVDPKNNTALEGLYQSSGNFCTQCEAEGFRRITYFLDRPDIMAKFTTTIEADKVRFPVMLSNGNPIDQGESGARHWIKWEDPFPKPCYLFALVAGDLVKIEDTFTTKSNRDIALHIFVEPQNHDKCDHAMQSLKKAMTWDEDVFGLEYDLDIYMIVAVDDFNMGAMENKGLNVFNSKYVLAKPDTATDADYEGIEGVIAHEYFHNWTGNRVTCRDWFQLSLKEGLTVFRDQEFSADMGARAVKRIQEVRVLKTAQFAQDAGPMAHPIRPEAYMEISNFYTVTVYNKGAEVIRMIHTLLGVDGFRRGMDLYFERHDGQAVTTEDFVAAMSDANQYDLGQFKRWYGQAGTPVLNVSTEYDADAKQYFITVEQSCPETPGQIDKKPFHIPFSVGLIADDGLPLALNYEGHLSEDSTLTLDVKEATQTFCFHDVASEPVPSLLRDFSAPVKLNYDYSSEQLAFLMANDQDEFNRWDAAQRFSINVIAGLVSDFQQDKSLVLDAKYSEVFAKTLMSSELDQSLIAEALTLPSENYLSEVFAQVDVEAIHVARQFLKKALAEAHQLALMGLYQTNQNDGEYQPSPKDIGQRRLKNLALSYLIELENQTCIDMCVGQFVLGGNMTDELSALQLLANKQCPERMMALEAFYYKWQNDPLVLDKWFSIQATTQIGDALNVVRHLMLHQDFNLKNPNKVRSLIGAFVSLNPYHFHAEDGSGYAFLADSVLKLDPMNPQIAARLVSAFTRWQKYDEHRRDLMITQLERIQQVEGLSKDVYEIVSKSLTG
jgi:aminopeptidase N